MNQDRLDAIFLALGDRTRRGILARLTQGEASVSELAKPFDMTFAAVSKHIKVLEQAGLVTRGKSAQWRPCRLEAAPLRDITAWLEEYRRFWDESVDRLEVYLKRLQQGEPLPKPEDNH